MIYTEIFGLRKSFIRCRGFCLLEIEFYKPFQDKKYNDWVAAYKGLINDVLDTSLFINIIEQTKMEVLCLIKEFEDKIKRLLKCGKIPYITTQKIGELTYTEHDYTNLESAKSLLIDYKNKLIFIEDCISEVSTNMIDKI